MRIIMPYKSRSELPLPVQENLPPHAEEIYKEAYNAAWEQYKNPKSRRGNETREEVAHKVAWAAVKKLYEKKEDGTWARKEEESSSHPIDDRVAGKERLDEVRNKTVDNKRKQGGEFNNKPSVQNR